jgi:hypothetical protein
MNSKRGSSVFVVVMFAAVLNSLATEGLKAATYDSSPAILTFAPAEKFVTNCLCNGKAADLNQFAGQGGSVVIRGDFVADLVSKSPISPHGMRIRNAVITNALNLANLEVGNRIALENCRFLDRVNLSSAVFRKDLSFAGSTFSGPVSFNEAHIAGQLTLSNAVFLVKANLNHLQIDGDLEASAVWFGGPTTMRGSSVGHYAALDAIPLFLDPAADPGLATALPASMEQAFENHGYLLSANFELRRFGDPATHWRLLDTNRHLAFSLWLKPKGYAVNQTTYIADDFDARGLSASRELTASDAYIRGAAHLDSLRVEDSMCLDASDFDGSVSLGFASIGHQFSAAYATFGSSLNLYNIHCGECVMNNASFREGVTYADATINSELELQYCYFGPAHVADFFATRVNGSAYLNSVNFDGPANFILMQVAGNFDASGARFLDTSSVSNLVVLTASRPSTFNSDFGSLRVDGFAFFYRAAFAGTVSFRNASFQNLFLDSVTNEAAAVGRTNTGSLRLEGMTFKRIRSVSDTNASLDNAALLESWQNLKRMLARYSPYTFETYNNIESYFRQEGQSGIADEVFIEGKRQERTQVLQPYSPPWILNYFLDYTIGFGRRSIRAAAWSLGLIALGAVLFGRYMRRKQDSPLKNARDRLKYFVNSFWYSLDMFIPVLDLGTSDEWVSKTHNGKILWYGYVHSMLGYIFVPIWLAALAGLIK